ncbi:MAG: hypothetical protein ABI186_09905 [Candidatus Elarobacter sp.]
MIVTRQRPRGGTARRLILPAVALVVLGIALAWPPSHRVIADGPLKPVWAALANGSAQLARPLSVVAVQQRVNDRDRTIRGLDAELEKQRRAQSDADGRVRRLQEQISELSSQPQPAPAPAPRLRAAPNAPFPVAGTGSTRAAGEKRLAATWSAMDPDKAAAVVQRLPLDEATRVLAAMDPDSAGAILDALPSGVAARISRAVAQVATATDR